jgi:hypothetical protein
MENHIHDEVCWLLHHTQYMEDHIHDELCWLLHHIQYKKDHIHDEQVRAAENCLDADVSCC